jgi:hypothetical protein
LYKKRSRSIASIETDMIAATKHIKDPEKRIYAISDHYCKIGSKNACQSLKCGLEDIKKPECKEHFEKSISGMKQAVENPMKYLLENKSYLSEEEFEDYKNGTIRLTRILKECKMGMSRECVLDGEKVDGSRELMIIGSKVNNLETLINDKKCNKKNMDACFSRDMSKISSEAMKMLQDLDV